MKRKQEARERETRRQEIHAEKATNKARKLRGDGQAPLEIGDGDEEELDEDSDEISEDAVKPGNDVDEKKVEGAKNEMDDDTEMNQSGGEKLVGEEREIAVKFSMRLMEAREEEDPIQVVMRRAKELVTDLDQRTPEEIFTDHSVSVLTFILFVKFEGKRFLKLLFQVG